MDLVFSKGKEIRDIRNVIAARVETDFPFNSDHRFVNSTISLEGDHSELSGNK